MKENYMLYKKDNKTYISGWGGGNIETTNNYVDLNNWGTRPSWKSTPFFNYPYYSDQYFAYTGLCTQKDMNPDSTGFQIKCCNGLNECFKDWNKNGKPYFICKEKC